MNSKNAIVIVLVILLAVLGFWAWKNYGSNAPELSREEATVLIDMSLPFECLEEGMEGYFGTCTVEVESMGRSAMVYATYDNLPDDSVKAVRFSASASYTGGAWVLGETSEAYLCQEGRGQQEFSAALCM